MSSQRKLTDEVRRLRDLSLDHGVVAPDRVTAVLAALSASRKPHELRPLLRGYLAAIRRESAKGEARVEFAGVLPESVSAALAAEFTKSYGRPVTVVTKQNDALIAGFRARVGDDVYDASAAGHLSKLSAALA
jgi:F-type H+-transporting ATPase subunit delta